MLHRHTKQIMVMLFNIANLKIDLLHFQEITTNGTKLRKKSSNISRENAFGWATLTRRKETGLKIGSIRKTIFRHSSTGMPENLITWDLKVLLILRFFIVIITPREEAVTKTQHERIFARYWKNH